MQNGRGQSVSRTSTRRKRARARKQRTRAERRNPSHEGIAFPLVMRADWELRADGSKEALALLKLRDQFRRNLRGINPTARILAHHGEPYLP